jgi:glycolate oxidase
MQNSRYGPGKVEARNRRRLTFSPIVADGAVYFGAFHDETVGLRADPEVVVRVTSAEQIAEIFRLAQRERVPVMLRGAGYGLSGGAVPVYGGIILSTEKMNRILEIDPKNLMVTVEPGVITGDFHRTVEAEGLFYPPDPASLDSCTIGGNIAEGGGAGPPSIRTTS